MNKKNKLTLSILLIIGFILISAIYLINKPDDMSELSNQTAESVEDKTIAKEILSSTKAGLERYNFDCGECNAEVGEYEEYENWIIASITLLDLPTESEARIMTYVFEKSNSSNSLNLIAFTGDGFSANSFPEGTSTVIIDKLTNY